jgi:competence protein ComEA
MRAFCTHINDVKGGGMNKLLKGLLLVVGLMAFPVFAAVNINTATQSELEAVKGLGPSKAKAIIQYREANGNFKHVNDLDNVKGFGKASIDKLKEELSVGSEPVKK